MLYKNLVLTLAAAAAMLPGAVSAQSATQPNAAGTQPPAAGLQAGSGASSSLPLDFSQIPGLDRPPKVQIDLTPALLNFASAAAKSSDNPEMAQALSGVRGVRLFVYDIGQDAKPVLDFIEASANTLEREGWQRAVYVQDDSDKVRLYVKSSGSQIAGLTMMVVEKGDEAVFINVDGSLDPVMLGRLASSLGAGDVLGQLGGQHGGAAKRPPRRAPRRSPESAPRTSPENPSENAPSAAPGSAPEAAPESAPETPAK
ncbi:MAG TPA: DUF4252 domain-containing protein [Gammaproteobacteria bacterium]|nr:DUF4252 domain-containing protein [Gammaproteobacteria bacterium]